METKHLFCAALIACASQAHAQSVTLYGLLDNSIEVANTGGGTTARMDPGMYLGSRFGMLGKEDIGGGYSINFVLEQGILTTTGAASVPNSAFGRQAWVGLGSPYGELRFGRQNSPVYIPVSGALDAFNGLTIGSGLISFLAIVPRVSNAISYQSPEIAGTKAQLMISLRDASNSSRNGIASYHIGIEYAKGPVGAVVGYQRVEDPVGVVWPGSSAGTVLKALYAGASYNFGNITFYLGYNNNRQSDTPLNRDVFTASVRYMFDPATFFSFGAAHLHDKSNLDSNADQVGVMLNYFLSKRTNVYAAASWIENHNRATFAMNGATTAGIPVAYPGAPARGVQLGMVHTF
jgi:predicted porin